MFAYSPSYRETSGLTTASPVPISNFLSGVITTTVDQKPETNYLLLRVSIVPFIMLGAFLQAYT